MAFALGGNSDTLARPIGPKMAAVLGQSVVADNRGGAGGALAALVAGAVFVVSVLRDRSRRGLLRERWEVERWT